MNAPAYIQADHRQHTIDVLEQLRDVLMARRAQVVKYRDEARATDDKQAADEFYAMQDAYRTAIDDVARAIQREQRT